MYRNTNSLTFNISVDVEFFSNSKVHEWDCQQNSSDVSGETQRIH